MFLVRPDLNTHEIEKRLNDYVLFKRYCLDFDSVNKKFSAEFRKDINPSAIIREYQGRLFYRDYGDPHQIKSYNIYNFIMHKYGLSFFETLKKINNDFKLGLAFSKEKVEVSTVKYSSSKNKCHKDNRSIIKVKKAKYSSDHLNYWESYKLSRPQIQNILTFFDVYPISHYWLTTQKLDNKCFVMNSIAFTYDFGWFNNIFMRKIYQPLVKNNSRFIGNAVKDIVQGYNQLPKNGDFLFITSSLKDAIVLRLIGFYAIAPSSEGTFVNEKLFYFNLKKRFKKIVLFYNNDFDKKDNYGLIYSQRYSKQYEIPYIILPERGKEKDPSDFAKTYNLRELNYVIQNELKNVGNYH
jgi:hypothetical protein